MLARCYRAYVGAGLAIIGSLIFYSCKALFKPRSSRVLSLANDLNSLSNSHLITHYVMGLKSLDPCPIKVAIADKLERLNPSKGIEIKAHSSCSYELRLKLGAEDEKGTGLKDIYLQLPEGSLVIQKAELAAKPSSFKVNVQLTAEARKKGIGLGLGSGSPEPPSDSSLPSDSSKAKP